MLSLSACSKQTEGVAEAKTSSATTPATPKAAPTPAPAADDTVSCKTLIDHIVKVEEAEKKEGIISAKNAPKMTARCEKANNIKDNPEVVKCMMAADTVSALGACKNVGKLLGPW